jgi:hypothetical protein
MTCLENVCRILVHLGLADSVTVTRCDAGRVWAWPLDQEGRANDLLLRHVVLSAWNVDIPEMAASMHGTRMSFREPRGVNPALQVCFHPAPPTHPADYFLELDIDFHAPDWRHPIGLLGHGIEVLKNWATRGKTDQEKLAVALDRRFGKENA